MVSSSTITSGRYQTRLLTLVAAFIATLVIAEAPSSSSENDTKFTCQIQGGVASTVASTPAGQRTVIQWRESYYSSSGIDLCKKVSARLETYMSQGILNYITTGRMNGLPVLCTARTEGGSCEGVLLTFPPGVNGTQELKNLLGLRVPVSGPINENQGRLYVSRQELTGTQVRASRIFAGPGQFPPSNFLAYGIVAFQALPTDKGEISRYETICKGFLAAIPTSNALIKYGVKTSQQMVTVWPVNNNNLADSLNPKADLNSQCLQAIRSIDLVASLSAIRSARAIVPNSDLSGRGPYVIAWAPAKLAGKPRASVLVLDLSSVTTSAQAVDMFRVWAEKIEKNPALWRRGWDFHQIRVILRLWADRWGPVMLTFITPRTN
jgi:hypothetical protein